MQPTQKQKNKPPENHKDIPENHWTHPACTGRHLKDTLPLQSQWHPEGLNQLPSPAPLSVAFWRVLQGLYNPHLQDKKQLFPIVITGLNSNKHCNPTATTSASSLYLRTNSYYLSLYMQSYYHSIFLCNNLGTFSAIFYILYTYVLIALFCECEKMCA